MSDEGWDVFLADCRRRLPLLCPLCSAPVRLGDPYCEEAADAHWWYQATFFCDCPEDDLGDSDCDWSMSFERLMHRDPGFGVDLDGESGFVRL